MLHWLVGPLLADVHPNLLTLFFFLFFLIKRKGEKVQRAESGGTGAL